MKIALVSADAFALLEQWRGLIRALTERGFEVDAIGPLGATQDKARALGVRYFAMPFSRFVAPAADMKLFWALFRHFRREHYNLVHTKEPKANVWGAIAAKAARVPRIVLTVSGLGFASSDATSFRARSLHRVLSAMYRVAFFCSDRVWFENPDNMRIMSLTGLLAAHKAVLIRGAGLDPALFSLLALDPRRVRAVRIELAGESQARFVVTMPVARLIWSKGVGEFVGAARQLADRFPLAQFVLIGAFDDGNPDAVPREWLESLKLPNLKWFDFRQDIREIIAASDAVALPSYYGEGLPRTLLEALALERPIITTDNVGCREVIRDGVNGIQVPMRDYSALAGAVESLGRTDPAVRAGMGREGRQLVEAEFSENFLAEKVLRELYGMADLEFAGAAGDAAATETGG